MSKDKFTAWLRLWRLGLVCDPNIVATIMDVSRAETWFYDLLSEKAEELSEIGLIRGTKGLDDPIPMDNIYWLGPDEVIDQFEEYVDLQLAELKARNSHRNFVEGEAYMGFRYWSVSGGERSLAEWRAHWLGN